MSVQGVAKDLPGLTTGLDPETAKYLDSLELENRFLAAINFQAPGCSFRTPANCTDKGCASLRDQIFHELKRSANNKTMNESTSCAVKAQESFLMPVQNRSAQVPNQGHSQMSSAHGHDQVCSSQWKRTSDQPEPLGSNYWETQRIAKGIVNPWAYPVRETTEAAWGAEQNAPAQEVATGTGSASHANNSQRLDRSTESPSADFWGMTVPKPFVDTPAPLQVNKVGASPPPQARPRDFAQTAPAELDQLFVPANPIPRTRIPQAPVYKNSPLRQPVAGAKQLTSPWQHAGAGPSQIDCLSPDLTAFRVPQPDDNYPGSGTPSLPSSVSAIHISDTGIGAQGGASTAERLSTDIRNTIGLKPDLPGLGQTFEPWGQQVLDDPWGEKETEDLWAESYLGAFISAWMNDVPDCILAPFDQGVPAHWECDFDTVTGCILPPVAYPTSMVDHSQIQPELEWRRQNWTSTLLLRRHISNPRRNQNFGRNQGFSNGPRRNFHCEVQEDITEMLEPDMIFKVHENPIEQTDYNRYVPRTPCLLRPAEKVDMEAVRLIYNWEVEHGRQALDTQPVEIADFEKILTTTQELGMPFIVAARGSARNLGLTKGHLAFSTFSQVPFPPQDHPKRGEILGFAYLSVWQPGLSASISNTAASTSRATARINVFVHPDHRRRKIGFALLDMLLTAVSDRFSSQSGYDFVDPDNSPVYLRNARAEARQRQYFKVYASYLVPHKHRVEPGDKKKAAEQKRDEEELAWVKGLLEEKANFTEVVRFEAVHRSAKKEREGKSEAVWLDEVVFEHTCLYDPLDPRIKADY